MGASTAQVSPPVDPAQAAGEATDGRLEIFAREGDVFAVVHPPAGGGRPVEFEQARQRLLEWPTDTHDLAALAAAVRHADGRAAPCGHLRPTKRAEAGAAVAVVADERRRAVFLVPWAGPDAPALTPEVLAATLAEAGVPNGLDDATRARLTGGPWREPVQIGRTDEVDVEAPTEDLAKQQAAAALRVPLEELEITVARPEGGGRLRRARGPVRVHARYVPRGDAVDGRLELDWKQGEVYLTVHPPAGGGHPVLLTDVADAVAELPRVQLDPDEVAHAVAEAAGTPVYVGTYVPAVATEDDAPVAVWVTGDELEAFLVPWAGESGAVIGVAAARAALAAAGVQHGIDEAALTKLEREPFTGPVLVARGRLAVDGVDAAVEWLVGSSEQRGQPLVFEDGHVDYHELGDDTAVVADTALATKRPVKPPQLGCTVLGRELPAADGKDVRLERHVGPGVKVNAEGTGLVSTIAGQVVRLGDKISVTAVRTIRGDVDFSVGNVAFEGSVVIGGNVKPGFRVRVTGSIQVKGEVDSADIEATGDIKVSGGILGEGGRAKAGKGLSASYLHSVDVEAAGPITVSGEVWQSRVACGDTVEVKGRIVGGSVLATRVVAETIGAPVGTPTTIEIVRRAADPAASGATASAPGHIVARKHVYQGVTVTILGAKLDVDQDFDGTEFLERNGQIEPSSRTH